MWQLFRAFIICERPSNDTKGTKGELWQEDGDCSSKSSAKQPPLRWWSAKHVLFFNWTIVTLVIDFRDARNYRTSDKLACRALLLLQLELEAEETTDQDCSVYDILLRSIAFHLFAFFCTRKKITFFFQCQSDGRRCLFHGNLTDKLYQTNRVALIIIIIIIVIQKSASSKEIWQRGHISTIVLFLFRPTFISEQSNV